MRSGGCAVQQELAGDAAAVMRQAVSLARRRGHAQVTPLHAATAMLADAGGLLRAACLRSRASSHPLQCKALELCFNVALNRLATAGPPAHAMFQQFHAHHAGHRAPALSNALAAAFKRAQANQRRGNSSASAEVAARVELEQLVISILDDPGVSRVMREAGFSSAEVKANVEKAASSPEQQSSNTASSATSAASPNTNKPSREAKAKADAAGDAVRLLDCMASGRSRCIVLVGESAAAAEGVVKAVMDKVSKGDLRLQHECLKNAQLVPFSAASFQRSPREEVEARARDLRALVREACTAGKGVVLVLEDLAYAAEAWAAASWNRSAHGRYYCPVEHAVMELSSLLRGAGGRGHGKFWLLGFAAYASYTSCRSGQPSLEAVLELHPVLVPDGSLAGDCRYTD
jgi:ATP-dependent Clp protease ATP-binding subunit ClpA